MRERAGGRGAGPRRATVVEVFGAELLGVPVVDVPCCVPTS